MRVARDPKAMARNEQVMKSISQAAATLHLAFTDGKDSPSVAPIRNRPEQPLLSDDSAPRPGQSLGELDRQMKLHFNVAEISFAMKDFDKAVLHYRWVVEHGAHKTPAEQTLIADCSLKAVSSKYEPLQCQGPLPQGS